MFDAGIGPHYDEDDTDEFLENIPYSLTSTDIGRDDLCWSQDDVEGMTIDASIIGPRDLHEMDNFDECDFIDDESNDEDDNEVEYSDDPFLFYYFHILCLVYVGEGSSYVRQLVEAANEEAHIFEDARPMASDDETQAPDVYVQTSALVQNPESVQIPEPVQYPPP
nr:hypothetical protein CFP56_27439 [Quercus suber]